MPPKVNHPVLILTQSGDVNPSHIQTTGPLTLQTILKFYKKKKGIDVIAKYKFKGLFLTLFGATEGEEAAQNQHQLPPPYDTETFYGDILLVAAKTSDDKSYEKPVEFKPEEYEEFYTKVFDGQADSDDENAIVDGADADAEAEPEVNEELDADEEAEEGKEFDEEVEEEEDEEGEAEAEAEAEDEEAVAAPTKAKAKKKKAAKTGPAAALAGTGSAYPDPPILSEAEQLQEETDGASGSTSPSAAKRQEILAALEKLFGDILSTEAIQTMERCIYNGAIRQARNRHVVRSWSYPLFAHLYKMHALHITSNFHPHSYVQNTELYDSFQKGDVTFENITAMNTYELFPSHWREMFEQRQIREKKQLEGNRDRATDQFTCTRCWKRECTYYEMQTRSADEPMTIFITCLNCGKKWRQ